MGKSIHGGSTRSFNEVCWIKMRKKYERMLGEEWKGIDANVNFESWLIKVNHEISWVRKQIRQVYAKMKQDRRHPYDDNPGAMANRMLRADKPVELTSIVDPMSKELVVQPDLIKKVLHEHYAKVFSCDEGEDEKKSPEEEPNWMKEVYGVQSHIQPTWYKELMSECNVNEVRHLFVKTKYVVSPGVDKVSAGIWKLGCEQSEDVCWAVCVMLNACLRLRMMPSLGKKSIIVPILKNEHGEKELSNIRPISLQTALTKLLSKLLADRLGAIFAKHPILHKAQEGFVVGGSVIKCIDVCLDIWEMAKKKKRGCYNLFYDIKAAYDSVWHSDLLRALRRLALPEGFVELVAHSLSGLTSCVRTVFGPTEDFAVKKSVRQGDPLAPLLFVILMDPLHCGLAKNPLYEGAQDGFKVTKDIQVASKGLAVLPL
jgi:hypothetical protein